MQIVGVDPRAYSGCEARPGELADPTADLRILLCHFPRIVDAHPGGVFDLVLAGHLHDGQIVAAVPGRASSGSRTSARAYVEGLYRLGGGELHVSPGLGTTFVPFRLFARPEATELVLQSA